MSQEISEDEYKEWLSRPMTKLVFSQLGEYREEINKALTNSELIMCENAMKELVRLVGMREGIDLFLEKYSDFGEIEGDDEDSSSGPQSSY